VSFFGRVGPTAGGFNPLPPPPDNYNPVLSLHYNCIQITLTVPHVISTYTVQVGSEVSSRRAGVPTIVRQNAHPNPVGQSTPLREPAGRRQSDRRRRSARTNPLPSRRHFVHVHVSKQEGVVCRRTTQRGHRAHVQKLRHSHDENHSRKAGSPKDLNRRDAQTELQS
jgi:hypothetical protein